MRGRPTYRIASHRKLGSKPAAPKAPMQIVDQNVLLRDRLPHTKGPSRQR